MTALALAAWIAASPTITSLIGPVDTALAPALANFLLDHPDAAADILRSRGLAPYRVTPLGPGRWSADDGRGMTGTVTLLEKSSDGRVFVAEGIVDRPHRPALRAAVLIRMRLVPSSEGCRPAIRTSYEVSVRLRNPLLSLLLKSMRRFLAHSAEAKFSRAFTAAGKLGELAAAQPDALFAEIAAHPGLSAAERSAVRALEAQSRAAAGRCPALPR